MTIHNFGHELLKYNKKKERITPDVLLASWKELPPLVVENACVEFLKTRNYNVIIKAT